MSFYLKISRKMKYIEISIYNFKSNYRKDTHFNVEIIPHKL